MDASKPATLAYKRSHFATHLPVSFLYTSSHAWLGQQPDGSWRIEICPACGEVTGVFDDREGWAMGHRAPVIQELHRTFVAAS
jgi:hypothetical protein